MPDITMCFGYDPEGAESGARTCPMAARCHRKTATPTPDRQGYFMLMPLAVDDTCEHFWPTEEPKS